MKTFKQYEAMLNLSLILFFGVKNLIGYNFNSLIEGYIIIGIIQVIGMIIHAINDWFTFKHSRRYVYNWVTGITIALMPTLVIFVALLYMAIPMAIYYLTICILELRTINKREFIHLKN